MNVSLHPVGVATRPAIDLALSLARSGRPIQAYDLARDIYDLAQQRQDPTLQGESADLLAECCVMMARYEQGIGFARNARLIWDAAGDVVRQAGATACLAKLLAWIGEPEAVTEAAEALDMAERAGEPRQIIGALQANALVLSILKQHIPAVSFAERSVALSRSAGIAFPVALSDLADILVCKALAARAGTIDAPCGEPFEGVVARAIALSWEARGVARRQGDGWVERLAINNVAEFSLHVGDVATAETALAAFHDTAGEPTDRCRLHHLSVKGRSLAAQGRFQDAVSAYTECLAAAQQTDDLEFCARCYLDLSDAQVELGGFEAALAAHRSFHDAFVRQASEAAQRRARLYALQQETEALRVTVADAQTLAQALAASNAQLAREAETLTRSSLEDPLTGLPNRRRWDAALVAVKGLSFAIAVIDIDHFKHVNDAFSHSAGDAVLREMGALLAGHARRDDLVVRYGGEEFTLLMHTVEREHAERTCERLRLLVQDHDWHRLQPGLAVSISVGVASSAEAATPDDVLHLADLRLYAAKNGGRNCVVATTP